MDALADTPVVLVHGPRQCGKSTLAHSAAEARGDFRYVNLDDAGPRNFAITDPGFFVESFTGSGFIDEVQRAPEIFLAIKASVDRDRRPGRFLMTGSSNILALPKLADSLAGRIAIVDLLPFSQLEVEGGKSNLIERLFSDERIEFRGDGVPDLNERLVRGGFPEASMRASAVRRDAWFADYVRSLLDRDVRDLSNIENLTQMPRILNLLATRAGTTLNIVSFARDTGLSNTTMHRYLDLLKAVFLLHTVPAWSNNRGTRLTKAPKAFLVDTGLLCYLDNITLSTLRSDRSRIGPVLENFVAMELKKLIGTSELRPTLYHLRTVHQKEVDFVLEARGGGVVGIEVKAAHTVGPADAEGLRYLQDLAGDRFHRGVVLYTGKETVPLSRDIWAMPIDSLWRL